MRNIKFIKAMRLSLLVAMLSLGFTTMSCSPSDDLSEDSQTVEVVDEYPETYEKIVFMISGTYYDNGVPTPKYDLVSVELDNLTDELVRINIVQRTHEELKTYAFMNYGSLMGMITTHIFLDYNYSKVCRVPLMINPNYETPEYQLSLHLSQAIIDALIERDRDPIHDNFQLDNVLEEIEALRDCYMMPY